MLALKTHLSSFAYAYCEGNLQREKSYFLKEHYIAMRTLRENRDIVITRADKGGGVVILNKDDYITKTSRYASSAAYGGRGPPGLIAPSGQT